MLSITAWSAAITFAIYAAIPLAGITLWAARRSRGRRERLLARLALAAMGAWVLLFIAWGLALRYGS